MSNQQDIDLILSHFTTEVCSALRKLLEVDYWPFPKRKDDTLEIIVDDYPSFRRTLTLYGITQPVEYEGNMILQSGLAYINEEQLFCFYGEMDDPFNDCTVPFAIRFADADVKVEVYNSIEGVSFYDNPWDYLWTACFSIVEKGRLPGEYCNKQELQLLPVLKEITALEYWMELVKQEFLTFPNLKAMADRYGYKKVVALLKKLETLRPDKPAYLRTSRELIARLSLQNCEPMWRELYDAIVQSQRDYPGKVQALCPDDVLCKTRREIEDKLHAYGYSGSYPDFEKTAPMSGIHLATSYNMTYFVGLEKRMRYYIHCTESLDDEVLTIQFLCGAASLKRGEPQDVYSCIFNAKGLRLFATMHHYIPMEQEEGTVPDDLDMDVSIAVKKAECRKLTKEEKKSYYGLMIPGWSTFFYVFLVMGGLFAVLMTLVMMLVCIVCTVLCGLYRQIPEMLSEIPWGCLFGLAWVGFGGLMGIMEVLARRK